MQTKTTAFFSPCKFTICSYLFPIYWFLGMNSIIQCDAIWVKCKCTNSTMRKKNAHILHINIAPAFPFFHSDCLIAVKNRSKLCSALFTRSNNITPVPYNQRTLYSIQYTAVSWFFYLFSLCFVVCCIYYILWSCECRRRRRRHRCFLFTTKRLTHSELPTYEKCSFPLHQSELLHLANSPIRCVCACICLLVCYFLSTHFYSRQWTLCK